MDEEVIEKLEKGEVEVEFITLKFEVANQDLLYFGWLIRLPWSRLEFHSPLFDILTHKSPFSHKENTFCWSQFSLPLHNSKSKCHNTLARIARISPMARPWPIQFLGPTLNGCNTFLLSPINLSSLGSSQRSGIKESGSAKLDAEWKAPYWRTPTDVYSLSDPGIENRKVMNK
jgi:hypothetical protein